MAGAGIEVSSGKPKAERAPYLRPPAQPLCTLLQDDGLAELLGANGEVLLLAGGDDGLKVIISSLQTQWDPQEGF